MDLLQTHIAYIWLLLKTFSYKEAVLAVYKFRPIIHYYSLAICKARHRLSVYVSRFVRNLLDVIRPFVVYRHPKVSTLRLFKGNKELTSTARKMIQF